MPTATFVCSDWPPSFSKSIPTGMTRRSTTKLANGMLRFCSRSVSTSTFRCWAYSWSRILATNQLLTPVSCFLPFRSRLPRTCLLTALDNFFSTVSYRYGHSEVGDIIFRLDDNGNEISEGHVPLFEAFFYPTFALNAGPSMHLLFSLVRLADPL